jgi:hypothetical protein
MAIPQGLSDTLTKIAPKRINDAVEKILDILNKVNEGVRKINEIDFCNPLGYILTKALPPGGVLENKMLQYAKKVTEFINNVENKMSPGRIESEIIKPGDTPEQIKIKDEAYKNRLLSYQASIEEIRTSLEEIIPPPDLVEIFPGGEGLVQTINSINLALTATSDTIDAKIDPKQTILTQISLLKSFSDKLRPFMSPINIATLAIGDQAEELNKKLRDFIRPERFASSVAFIIRQVKAIDKGIAQILKTVQLINTILKLINVLVKIFKFVCKILKIAPMPVAVGGGGSPVVAVTTGSLTSKADRVAKFQTDIDDYAKIIRMISTFLSKSIILQIQRIRKEIIRLLTGLNILYKNLLACPYTNDPLLEQSLLDAISSLENNLTTLDNLFPTAKTDNILPSLYGGYEIDIIKEEVVDAGIKLLRRRVIVADQRGITVYEGTPTFASDDQVLIKEGQYQIDKLGNVGTSDEGNSAPTNQQIIDEMNELGFNPNDVTVTPNDID